jgi:Ca-activated chloride channel family protein
MSLSGSVKIPHSRVPARGMRGALRLCMLVLLVPATCCATSLYDTVKKGSDLYAQEKYDEALNAFVDAQVEHPEDARLKYNIASSKYMMKNYEEALQGYLDIAATARDTRLEEKALFNAGNTLYRQGKLEQAVEYYKKALALAPEDKDAQQNLEFVREEIKRRMNEAQNTQKQQQEQEQKKDQNCKNPQQQDNQTQSDGQQQQQEKKDQQQEEKKDEQQQGQDQQGQDQQQPQAQQPAAAGNEKAPQDEKQQGAPADTRQMSKDEAEQWLNSVRENRDNLKEGKQRARTQGGVRSGKDW